MAEMTETLELNKTSAIGEATSTGLETPTIPAPVVIATPLEIRVGSVLVKSGSHLPDSALFESKHLGRWTLLTEANGFEVERVLSQAGWHCFFMVPQVAFGALSFSRNKAMKAALRKIFAADETQRVNAIEIVEIKAKNILGFHYVKIVVHARHIKKQPVSAPS